MKLMHIFEALARAHDPKGVPITSAIRGPDPVGADSHRREELQASLSQGLELSYALQIMLKICCKGGGG